MQNKKKITYIITTEYKTTKDNKTEKELTKSFNKKYFKTIMKIAKT